MNLTVVVDAFIVGLYWYLAWCFYRRKLRISTKRIKISNLVMAIVYIAISGQFYYLAVSAYK